MERTEELVSLFSMHGYSGWAAAQATRDGASEAVSERGSEGVSGGVLQATQRRAAAVIRSNSQLLHRMSKLIQRKEFSNDPTVELNEISETFQQKLVSVKRDLEALAGLVAQHKQQHKQRRSGAHSEQHWAYILSGLQQQVSADIATFQTSLRQHGQQVQQRESRITKFGQGSDQVRRGQSTLPPSPQRHLQQGDSMSGTGSGGYALFAPPPPTGPRGVPDSTGVLPRPGRNQGVMRRRNNAGGPRANGSGSNGINENSSGTTEQIGAGALANEHSEGNNGKSAADKGRRKFFSVAHPTLQFGGGQVAQQQLDHRQGRQRSEQSKMVEESIGKMGQLFSQMSSLVLAQAETISRIEDDVEAGLEDTTEAHTDMVYVHEITKGNRGLILKIFALLIFFIMLFMVWT